MTDLTGGIRRAAEPPRPQGHREPSTAGRNAGDPTLTGRAPVVPAGASAPAFPVPVRRHEDHGWHEMHAVEHRAYTETMVAVELTAGQSLTLDPTRAQVWRVLANGNGITISVPMPEFPAPDTVRQDGPERLRTWSCVLIVEVPDAYTLPSIVGANWSEHQDSPNVSDGSGLQQESFGGVYMFTFMFDPVGERVLGAVGGMRI